jgi:hypothetical protein
MVTNKELQPTACVDFDGVIAEYSGFQGIGVFGKPIGGTVEALQQLHNDGWHIIVFTSRVEQDRIASYLRNNGIPYDEIAWKPMADVYIDDRAIRFTDWKSTQAALDAATVGGYKG